jgi:hypothetical protein
MKVIGSALYQWEVGRKIQVLTSVGDRAVMVQFAHPGDKEALSVTPKEENGVIVANIPNILLQSGDKIIAFLVEVDTNYVETIRHSVFQVINRPKPSDYVYTETEVLNYNSLASRIDQIEQAGVSDEQIANAVEKYLDENPVDPGVSFETDNTLVLKDGILSVNTTNQMEQDNTLPITSAGVFATVGNIEALLKTI